MMELQKERPLSDFTVVIDPALGSRHALSVTVQKDRRFALNGQLSALLNGKAIEIRFTPDGKYICLTDATEDCTAVRFPKNGAKKIKAAAEFLEQSLIPLPAKYDIQYGDETRSFQGVHIENPTKPPLKKGRSSAKN